MIHKCIKDSQDAAIYFGLLSMSLRAPDKHSDYLRCCAALNLAKYRQPQYAEFLEKLFALANHNPELRGFIERLV